MPGECRVSNEGEATALGKSLPSSFSHLVVRTVRTGDIPETRSLLCH